MDLSGEGLIPYNEAAKRIRDAEATVSDIIHAATTPGRSSRAPYGETAPMPIEDAVIRAYLRGRDDERKALEKQAKNFKRLEVQLTELQMKMKELING